MSHSAYAAAVLAQAHGYDVDLPPRRTEVALQPHFEGLTA